MMAFTSVEDLTGTMEVIVFPKVLDRFRDAIQENAVVVIDGRLSVREDEASKLLADSILPIDSYDPTRLDKGRPDPVKTAARRVFIRLPSRSCPVKECCASCGHVRWKTCASCAVLCHGTFKSKQ